MLKYIASKFRSGAVVVSGNELQMALQAGFKANKIVFNGNGKTQKELNFAVKKDVLINIDSEFDLEHIIKAGQQNGKKARAILRINPDIDPKVHPYVSTGLASSKFGIESDKLHNYLKRIREANKHINLIGVHCHIGSTIEEIKLFRDAATIMADYVKEIRGQGFDIEYLNIGGGLNIDYKHDEKIVSSGLGEELPPQRIRLPTPIELVESIRDLILSNNLKLIIEPGRSLVGNTSILVNRVIGVKSNGAK